MQKILSSIVFLLFLSQLQAQNILIGVGSGGASFDMGGVKQYNDYVIGQLPFNPTVIENFPAYYYFEADVLYSFPKLMAIGADISYTSTGSRINLHDYSGKYNYDNLQSGYFTGLKMLLGKNLGKKNGLCASLGLGTSFTTMKMEQELQVQEENNTLEEEMKSNGYYLRPGINYFLKIIPEIQIAASVKYHLGFDKTYHMVGEDDAKLINPDTGSEVKPGWNGIRVGLTVYWNIEN